MNNLSNAQRATKLNLDRLTFLNTDLARQIVEINKQIEVLERSKQTLLECRANNDELGRLMMMDLAGK